MELSGEGALALMLDAYKFFDMMQYSVKSESLAQLSNQIASLLRKVAQDKLVLQALVPISQYASSQSLGEDGTCEEKGAVSGSTRCQSRDEMALKGVLGDVFQSCDPHMVSGMCCFLHHLFLAFPDFIATQCHSNATVVLLAR